MMKTEQIECGKCSAKIQVTMPELAVMNHPTALFIFGCHPIGFSCAACGTYYLPAIVAVEKVGWQWTEAERPAEVSPLIIPAGLRLVDH